ncbi:hypothetical protein GCM10009827_109690 [Dactylosporangium maewongense]|uniref:Uncharacterized protein n=2 Tax=Dactylosporangium maewongense TaxID=634393 RepID=A0ABN2D554_9ACTN
MKPPRLGVLLLVFGLAALSWLGHVVVNAEPVVLFASRLGSYEVPQWARDQEQPWRELVMDVAISGRAERLDIRVSYELRVWAEDPLLSLVNQGKVDGQDLGRFLAYGPVNTPVTVERSDGGDTAKLHFGYVGTNSPRLFLGDEPSIENLAADHVDRWLTVRTDDVVISHLVPEPVAQQPRFAYFAGQPQPVSITLANDVPAPSEAADARLSELVDSDVGVWRQWLVWFLVTTAPFLLLARARPWLSCFADAARTADAARIAGLLGMTLGVVAALASVGSHYLPFGVGTSAGLVVLIVIAGLAPALRRPPVHAARTGGGAVLATLAVLAGFAVGVAQWLLLLLLMALAAGVARAGIALVGGDRNRAFTAVVWTAGIAMALGLVERLFDLPFTVVLLAANLIAAFAVVAMSQARSAWLRLAATLSCGVVTMPVVELFVDPRRFLTFYGGGEYVLPQIARLLAVGAGVGVIVFLRRTGRAGAALGSPMVLTATLVLLLFATTDPFPFSWLHLPATGWLWLAWLWAVPAARRGRAVRLADVDAKRHRKLVGAETRRRLAEASAHDLYRKTRARLGTPEVQLREYDDAQHALDNVAQLPVPSHAITSLDALCTGGGATPWRNAVRAVSYATPVAALLVGYELFALAAPDSGAAAMRERTVADLVELFAHMARWFVYALLFGFLYPLLRGDGPVTKAAAFVVALLGVELLPIFDLSGRSGAESSVLTPASGREVLLALLIRLGQLVMFFGVLSLLWERWLARAAGYSWDRVRNVRSARALVAPVGTVVIAGLTTAATALAGAAVVALLATGPGPSTDPGTRSTSGATP